MNSQLLFAEVPIVSWDSCKADYGIYLDSKMLCAGSTEKDACQVFVSILIINIISTVYFREIQGDL